MKRVKKGIIFLIICIFICILMFAVAGSRNPGQRDTQTQNAVDGMDSATDSMDNAEEEISFQVTDNRDSYEIVYYKCASDFIADCGFEEDKPFWEYDTEDGSLQLALYYDDASGEGCGIRYYPEEENKQEEGFRFYAGNFGEPQYSVMEAWADLASASRLSCKRSTGKTAVSEYEESIERSLDYPYGIQHFESKGIVKSDEDENPSSLLEIDWTYRDDGTLQRKEYRHNTSVFGTYRSSADYYYGEDERLLYQSFYAAHGSGDVYYIYGEDEVFPEFYLHIDHDQGILEVELISYDSEIPEEDRLNLDEEMILTPFAGYPHADIERYDDGGNAVVHLYEAIKNEDESHTATMDWITIDPDTGIGINFRGEIVDIMQDDEMTLYCQFLNGKITDANGGEILSSYYENGSLNYTYVDLNDDGIQELIIYPPGIFMQILTIDQEEIYWVSPPFYSGATREIINENKEIVMVDESHAGRNQYSVYRLNDENEMEAVIFFQVWFAGEYTGLEETKYTQYIGGLEEGTEESITEDEFHELYEKYVQNTLDVEWKQKAKE
ncbi:MAG: hypothetical protein J6K58_13300 [Lachnospiraceae bacterium]|nr:hypothetical protein [Lachnospiraceae bacterium]